MKLFGLEIKRQTNDVPVLPSADTASPLIPFMMKGYDVVNNDTTAMKIAAVFRCEDILSKTAAQLPLHLYKRQPEQHFLRDPRAFDLDYLLAVRPNDRMTSFELIRNTLIQCMNRGNAYITWDQDYNGDYQRIVLVTPGCCQYDKLQNLYHINDPLNNINDVRDADHMIHIRNITLDGGYKGVSTLTYAGQVLAISANADKLDVDTFKSGGLVRGFVSGKDQTVGFGQVQDAQMKNVADRIENELTSGKNIFNLPGEMDFERISLSPNDIQLLQTKEFNVLEICRFFGVHPDKVFAQQASNYKASEMSSIAFLTDTLQPWLQQIELEFQCKLIPRELHENYKIKFDLEPLMTTDLNTQADYMKKTIEMGVRSINDWRLSSGKAPAKDGDDLLVSANLIKLGSKKLSGE